MVWIRAASKHGDTVRADLDRLRTFLADVGASGPLMPTVVELRDEGEGVFRYELEEFDNGAVSLAPRYQVRFDASDPAQISWEPYGEHSFKSWGVFRTSAGVDGESQLEIETRSEIDVPVAAVMAVLVEPFAQSSMDEVTEGFLAALKRHAESWNGPEDA
ncbi:hypothetical protein ABZV77_30910 [Streptomyces sp. NPDC004732]|uniref:hypothetical protein n=1 Tax=Streptomyces sp. NPDC004732 TaxID=3154290 RepID=UPI0033A5031B